MPRGFVIALVGAESTGKTQLAHQLGTALVADGFDATVVPEYLREFCDREGRTPVQSEQAAIALEQTRRIEAAAAQHEVVVADTTALMIAVYSELVFGDLSLYAEAQAAHARCGLTLLTALDLPWVADGHMRDGEHVREPVDALVRAALMRVGKGYAVVSGSGRHRLDVALTAVRHALHTSTAEHEAGSNPAWTWVCERCGDPGCERHLLPKLS